MVSQTKSCSITLDTKKIAYVCSIAKKHKYTRLKKGKVEPNLSKGLDIIIEDHKEIPALKQTINELEVKNLYLTDYASGKKEEKLYNKARGFNFHKNCYDMLPVEGDPNAKECVCPPSKRPVVIPKDKKTDKYIVRDPRVCGRCLALGCRKVTEKPKPLRNSKKKTQRDYCKRDGIYKEYLDRTCLECKWTISECPVKRRIQKLAIPR